jgi:hypothetical protein
MVCLSFSRNVQQHAKIKPADENKTDGPDRSCFRQ